MIFIIDILRTGVRYLFSINNVRTMTYLQPISILKKVGFTISSISFSDYLSFLLNPKLLMLARPEFSSGWAIITALFFQDNHKRIPLCRAGELNI